MYLVSFKHFNAVAERCHSSKSLLAPISHKVVSRPYLLLDSRHILTLMSSLPSTATPWREIVVPTSRIVLLSGASRVELSRYDLLVHLGCYSPHARRCERRTVGLKDAEYRFPLFVYALFVLGYMLGWAKGQFLIARK